MSTTATILAGLAGLPVGSLVNRLAVAEPGYVITDPKDLPEDADPALLDELEPPPTDLPAVPLLAVVRPRSWWRRWFPVVEVVTAGWFALVVHRLGWGWVTAAVLFLVAALMTLSTTDLRVYRIPDRINFPAMGIGAGCIVVAAVAVGVPGSIVGAAVGGLLYAGMLFLAHIASPRGMGWGDVKLAWPMGAYLGWFGWRSGGVVDQVVGPLRWVLLGAAIGMVIGVVTGAAYALARRSLTAVYPYGPSLAAGCVLALLWGDSLT